MVVWLHINHIESSQTSPGLTLMLLAWCLIEVVRYSYYATNLVNVNVQVLTWLRYTLFIVLYPMGATGELWCYFDSLSYLKNSKVMRLEMPNDFNLTFCPYVATMMLMIAYAPGFPPMYLHMLAQRRKVLGSSEKLKKAA